MADFRSVREKKLYNRNKRTGANGANDYWESGMDIGLSQDMFESFVKYQRRIQAEFATLQVQYGFEVINGNRTSRAIQLELQAKLAHVLGVE